MAAINLYKNQMQKDRYYISEDGYLVYCYVSVRNIHSRFTVINGVFCTPKNGKLLLVCLNGSNQTIFTGR